MNFCDVSPFKIKAREGKAPLISLRRARPGKGSRNLQSLIDPPRTAPPFLLEESGNAPPPPLQNLITRPLPLHPQTNSTPPKHENPPLQMKAPASPSETQSDPLTPELQWAESTFQADVLSFLRNEDNTDTHSASAVDSPLVNRFNKKESAEDTPAPWENDKIETPTSPSETLNTEPPCPFDPVPMDPSDPYDWHARARPEQCEPEGNWRLWLILAGRGFGKTRTGAECVRAWVASNRYKRIGLIGATDDDIRHVMVEGCSGILSTYPPEDAPKYEPSKRQITWPNGTVAHLISAERFEKLRGRQFDAVWVDELAKFRYAQETWDQLMLAVRLGDHPKMIVTTTPRPTALIKRLATPSAWSVITRGSTYANKDNLAPGFIEHIQESCQNEKLLRQEIEGEIVDDVAGALWRRETLDHQRVSADQLPEMQRVVVAVDPSVAHHDEGDETGIVVAGLGVDQKGYVLADLSGRYGTPGWAEQVLNAYVTFEADCIIAEENQGGALVEQVLRTIDPDVFYQKVHAARGKLARAEPVAALYARGRVHHVGTDLHHLERQLCTYVPGVSAQSPDRLDALVWAISSLMLNRLRPKKTRLWSMENARLLPDPPKIIAPHTGILLQ